MDNKIFIASDHAGFDLKQKLIEEMPNDTFEDLGTNSKESVDYTDYANKLADRLGKDNNRKGVFVVLNIHWFTRCIHIIITHYSAFRFTGQFWNNTFL